MVYFLFFCENLTDAQKENTNAEMILLRQYVLQAKDNEVHAFIDTATYFEPSQEVAWWCSVFSQRSLRLCEREFGTGLLRPRTEFFEKTTHATAQRRHGLSQKNVAAWRRRAREKAVQRACLHRYSDVL